MIRSERAHLQVVAQSHPGMSGKNNEDRYAVSAYRLSKKNATPALLAVLCDGIGGHRSGEVAAEMAVDSISQAIAASEGELPQQTVREAVQAASRRIYESAQEDPSRSGMGATCALAWVIGKRLYTTTVGDSRIYLLRGGAIRQVSTDHTWVQEALEKGLITPDQATGHPNAHVIRRYLGSPVPPAPDFRMRLEPEESDRQAAANQGFELQPYDRLLLCSDGLTDLVSADEICAALSDSSLDRAVQSLVDLANQRGGHDNITVVALSVPRRGALAAFFGSTGRAAVVGCLGVVTLALLAVVAYLGYQYWLGSRLPLATQSPTPALTQPGVVPSFRPSPTTRGGALVTVTVTQRATTPSPAGTSCSGLACSTATRNPALPTLSGPTLTPWPTDTRAPAQSP